MLLSETFRLDKPKICQILFPPIFFSVFQVVSDSVKIVDVILISYILTAHPVCQNILDLIALAILLRGEVYKSGSFTLYNIIHYTFHFCKIQIFSLVFQVFSRQFQYTLLS
jgi:hypothetical protein